jgi:hypothetical protein
MLIGTAALCPSQLPYIHYANNMWPFSSFLLYSRMWAFASLIDLFQSSLFSDLCSQFLILYFIISPYTRSHHLYLGLPVGRLPWRWLAKTWYSIILLSILLTWPIHLNLFILINKTISKSPYCNVLGVLYSRWKFIALQKSIHYS